MLAAIRDLGTSIAALKHEFDAHRSESNGNFQALENNVNSLRREVNMQFRVQELNLQNHTRRSAVAYSIPFVCARLAVDAMIPVGAGSRVASTTTVDRIHAFDCCKDEDNGEYQLPAPQSKNQGKSSG